MARETVSVLREIIEKIALCNVPCACRGFRRSTDVLPLLCAVLLTSIVNRGPRRARRVREVPGSQASGTGKRSASTCEQVPLAYVPWLVLASVLVVALHRTAQVTLLARHVAWNHAQEGNALLSTTQHPRPFLHVMRT